MFTFCLPWYRQWFNTNFTMLTMIILILSPTKICAAGCASCSASSLRTLSATDAQASGLLQAIGTTTPTGTVGTNSAGCTTLQLTCAAGQVVSIHVILANQDTDFGNYDSGVITLGCSTAGQWLVPANAQHPGDVVDAYSCVTSNLG